MKKRLVFIYRSPERGRYSIEEIFRNIVSEARKKIDVVNYYWNNSKSILSNICELRSLKADHYHITGDLHWVNIFLGSKSSLTIHDIGYYKTLKGIKKVIYRLIWLDLPIYKAKKVNTISDYTKQDLINHIPISKRKVEVIYNPVGQIFRPSKISTAQPFTILHIGTKVHKNLKTLILACRNSDYRLLILGNLDNDQKLLLKECKTDFINYSNLKTSEVVDLYLKCNMVYFVSLHEGFGMPIIEAQSVGRPVLTSRLCSLPEVGGDSVYYISNPLSSKEVRKGIDEIASDNELAMKYILLGFKNVKRFQVEEITAKYIEFFDL